MIFMYKEEPTKTILLFSEEIFKNIIPKDHILYRIDQEIDFSFVNEICKGMYSPDIGRRVVNFPERMFRAELIQYFNKFSDRQLMEQVNLNILFRWFIGYGLDDKVFHWTAPGKFRIALGKEKHKEIFDRILDQLIEMGLIGKNENQSIDATDIVGDIAIPTTIGIVKQVVKNAIVIVKKRVKILMPKIKEEIDVDYYIKQKGKKEYKMNDEEKQKTLNQVVSDALKVTWIIELALEKCELRLTPKNKRQLLDALTAIKKILGDYIKEVPNEVVDKSDSHKPRKRGKPNKKNRCIPRKKKGKDRLVSMVDKDVRWGAKSDKKTFAGYKAHDTMTDSGFITNIEVTPGNVSDDSMAVPVTKHQKERHGLKPKKMRGDGIYGTVDNRKDFKKMETQLVAPERTSHNNGEFSKDKFKFDEMNGLLTCPAGKCSTVHYYNKGTKSNVYLFDKLQCGLCQYKKKCTKADFRTVSIHKDFAIQQEAMEYNNTDEYKEDMKIRAHIEPKQAEMKRFHGLTRAIYRGLERVNIQAIFTAIVVNLKRMVTVLSSVSFQSKAFE